MLNSILTSESTGSLSVIGFLICILSPLVLGFVLTMVYRTYARPTKSFAVTLSTLPAIVSVIIMMVSGSLGAGVAVAGTFSLVRFRSAAGTAREIGAIFTAMAIGLACGMGYPVFALMFTAVLCGAYLLYDRIGFIWESKGSLRRTLCVTVPEDLEYGGMFDEIMLDNAKSHLTDHVMDTFTEKLGITLNYGAVSTPETRGIVERFFKTIEIKGFHTLPGTTGSNSRDIKAKDARKQAIKYGITFDEVCQIMEYLICEYNNTPHSTLLNRTPLEVMGERLEQGMLPHIASDMEKKEADRMLFFDKEVTVRGSIKSGKRPHINYLGARYRGDILSVNYEFLGKKLFLRIDPDDISSIEAYSEDCDYIEKIRAVGEYGHKKHSIVTRKLAIKYANANKKEHSDFETPLTDLEQSLKKRAAKSKKARTRVDIMQREQDAKKKGPGRKKRAELIPIDPKAREKDRALDPKVQDMTSEETWIHMLSNKERRSL